MQYAFLSFLAAMAVGEYIITGRLSLGGAALVYVVLRLQAERAADHFAKYGKDGPPPPPWHVPEEDFEPWVKPEERAAENSPSDEEIKVAPLGGKRKQKQYYGPRPSPAAEPSREARVLPFPAREPRKEAPKPGPSPAARKPAPPSAPEFGEPRFHGAPHEVLGIEREAGTQQIIRAFRHWIKKHHPDHAGPGGAVHAGERARRLHEAKNALLKARQKRGAKAASA